MWYGSGAWTLPQTAKEMLNVFWRKVSRRIYGPVLVIGQWRNGCNHEIYKLYKEMEVTRNTRKRRLCWVSNVMIKDERVPRRQ